MPGGLPDGVLSAIREVQIPLLAVMLLGGCGAKGIRVLKSRELSVALGPTALFPLRLRRPIAIAMCATELGLGVALLVTAGPLGTGTPATIVRAGVSVLFLIAVGALVELRERRPDAGCGCFGDLSVTPVGARTIGRSAVLATAALATIGQPPLQMPASGRAAALWITILVAELLLLAALSPELSEAMVRLGYSEPCEVRRISVDRTLAALASSATWRRYASLIDGDGRDAAPIDIWREGCWRYLVYTGETGGRQVHVAFAVYLRSRRSPVRVAVLDAFSGEVLTGAPRSRPALDRETSQPEPVRSRPRRQPELDVTRPMAGSGPGARVRLDPTAPLAAPARHRTSAPF